MIKSSFHLREADASSSQPTAVLAANTLPMAILGSLNELEFDYIDSAISHLKKRKSEVSDKKWKDCVDKVAKKGTADNAYAVCTAQLGKPKESNKMKIKIGYKDLKEADAAPKDPNRFIIRLIQEGLGNFHDAFYYTREALQSAVPWFEGKKVYANHPSASDETDRPERDVRDILAHIEDVQLVDMDGRAELHGTMVIPSDESFDWARAMSEHALSYSQKYGDKDFVGLSINASGDAEEKPIEDVLQTAPTACQPKLLEAQAKGINIVKIVHLIEDAISCDLVTEAGAGGKILKLMEEAKTMSKNKVIEAEDGDKDHADAAQDKELIGKMLKKHLGDMASEEEKQEAMGHYEGYKEQGLEADEAMKCATAHMKYERRKKEKMAQAEAEKDPSTMSPEHESETKHEAVESESETEKKESQVVALAGRVAFLEKELKAERLTKHIDKKLSESKLPMKATKLFKEKAGVMKDEKDFDTKFAIFCEAYNAERDESFSFILGTEKVDTTTTDDGLSFADCAQE